MSLTSMIADHVPAASWLLRKLGLAKFEARPVQGIVKDELVLSMGSSSAWIARKAQFVADAEQSGNRGFYQNIARHAKAVSEAPTGADVIKIMREIHPNFHETTVGEAAVARIGELPYPDATQRASDLWKVKDLIRQQQSKRFYDRLAFFNAAARSA